MNFIIIFLLLFPSYYISNSSVTESSEMNKTQNDCYNKEETETLYCWVSVSLSIPSKLDNKYYNFYSSIFIPKVTDDYRYRYRLNHIEAQFVEYVYNNYEEFRSYLPLDQHRNSRPAGAVFLQPKYYSLEKAKESFDNKHSKVPVGWVYIFVEGFKYDPCKDWHEGYDEYPEELKNKLFGKQ